MKFRVDHDYHIHTKLSKCSNDDEQTVHRLLKYAENNNFREICITDHYWDSYVDGASEWYKPQNYEHISSVLPLPQANGVKIYFGCETEVTKDMTLGISDKTINKFDFIIIPTTHLHMTGFTIAEEHTSVEQRAEIYTDRLYKLLTMDLPFEKIGIAHLTCQLIAYHWETDWDEHIRIIDAIATDTYRELFGMIAKKGAGFELNFNINKYSDNQLERILRPYKIAKEMGCKFYLGSDAHHPHTLHDSKENFEKIVSVLELKDTDRFCINK